MSKLRMGMVGGAPDAFIGPVHRRAAQLNGRTEVVSGAFSASPAKSREAGLHYGIAPERAYDDYEQMFAAERLRADPIDFVAIVTPTALHFPIARAALAAGFHVLSDKPATATLAEANALRQCVANAGRHYGLTYTYTGYAMVRQARELCRAGKIGSIRKIVVEYNSGWVGMAIKRLGLDVKPLNWRFDPARAAIGGAFGDIGVHALNMLEFVSGRRVSELCAQLSGPMGDQGLFDDGNVLLRLDNGAPGLLIASGLATGDRNDLRLRIYGDRGGLLWSHDRPDMLTIGWHDGRTEIQHAGTDALYSAAARSTRLPVGHPEGYIEAFANIYDDFADLLTGASAADPGFVSGIDAGVRGMAFIEAAVASSRAGSAWVSIL